MAEMKNGKRDIGDDCIRAISIIFVILVHVKNQPWKYENSPWLFGFVQTIIIACNGYYFMLSGKYNLRKEFNTKEDYLVFYKKRFIDIIFPYIVVSMGLSLWNMKLADMQFGFVTFIKVFLTDLFSSNASIHLWFMYCLIGYIISTPFLSKMLHAMKDWELWLIFYIIIIWNILSVYVASYHQIGFAYSGWIFSGWIIYYFVGYFMDRCLDASNIKGFMWGGTRHTC